MTVKINGVALVAQPADNTTARKCAGAQGTYDKGYQAGRFDQVYNWTMPENSWYWLGYKDGMAALADAMRASLA